MAAADHEPEFPPDAEVDPRVEDELDKMNIVAQQLNEMETLLEAARQKFRHLLAETSVRLDSLQKQLGSCVEQARPYYESKRQVKLLQTETQLAALRYDRACEMLSSAKEMVRTAEQACAPEQSVGHMDETWAVMLNHATEKVSGAERTRVNAAKEHAQLTQRFIVAQQANTNLEKELKRVVRKSRKYFEVNARCQQCLQEQKQHVEVYEEKVRICKRLYEEALKTLESISEEIHLRRRNEALLRSNLGERGEGVGAEDPPALHEEVPLSNQNHVEEPELCDIVKEDVDNSRKPRTLSSSSSKKLRSSLAMPIMSLLQDAMKEHAKENARLEQRRHLTDSPALSIASSLDDDTLAEYAVPNDDCATVSNSEQEPQSQSTLYLPPDLRRILHKS